MSNHIGDLPPRPAGIRDPLADYRKAVEAKIALHRSLGETPPDHLLHQLADLDAKEGHVTEFEHAAADSLPENAVRRGPGRPRKLTDADRAASSE